MLVHAIACAALATAGAAQQAGAAAAAGATDWFGRGIVGVQQSGTEVRLELRTEAHGMLLRLVEGEPITIVAVGPFAAGASIVRLPPPQPAEPVTAEPKRPSTIAVSTSRRPMPSPGPTRAPPEYLLLVLSDQRPDSTAIGRIRSIPGFDPATAAHDLAEYLVGRQSPMWAGYLVRR